MERRSFNWVVVALVGIGLAGVVAVSAASALAARSAASPFELFYQGHWEADWEADPSYGLPAVLVGTFTSGAPFCESGTADDPTWSRDPVRRRYTCSDGSGSLTLGMTNPLAAYDGIGQGEWTIVEGSGRYAGLRGKGSYTGEALEQDPEHGGITIEFRTTSQGFVTADAVAPSIAFTDASATKLRRPAGAYSIRVSLSLRDDIEGTTVVYRLRVREGPEHPRDRRLALLEEKEGSTAGSVSTMFRVFPSSKRVRSVQLLLSGSDPVWGNEVSDHTVAEASTLGGCARERARARSQLAPALGTNAEGAPLGLLDRGRWCRGQPVAATGIGANSRSASVNVDRGLVVPPPPTRAPRSAR